MPGWLRWRPIAGWLIVGLALATPVGMLVYSELATDLWIARGLYASVSPAALLLATAADEQGRRISRRAGLLGGTGCDLFVLRGGTEAPPPGVQLISCRRFPSGIMATTVSTYRRTG